MDLVKEAFQKVKQDMDSLKEELNSMRNDLIETRERMIEVCEIIKKLSQKTPTLEQNKEENVSTIRHINETISTNNTTNNPSFKPLKPSILGISTGNEGVSTDRQTDRQTDKNKEIFPKTEKNTIDNAAEILDSLDKIKKEIRLKFKRITDQELLVFSTIYQLDEENDHADYKEISKRLNLTESSIRDYVGRLIKKGVPVEKKRINNKTIVLNISQNLKKIASLSTILQLREL